MKRDGVSGEDTPGPELAWRLTKDTTFLGGLPTLRFSGISRQPTRAKSRVYARRTESAAHGDPASTIEEEVCGQGLCSDMLRLSWRSRPKVNFNEIPKKLEVNVAYACASLTVEQPGSSIREFFAKE